MSASSRGFDVDDRLTVFLHAPWQQAHMAIQIHHRFRSLRRSAILRVRSVSYHDLPGEQYDPVRFVGSAGALLALADFASTRTESINVHPGEDGKVSSLGFCPTYRASKLTFSSYSSILRHRRNLHGLRTLHTARFGTLRQLENCPRLPYDFRLDYPSS